MGNTLLQGPKHKAEVFLKDTVGHTIIRQCNFTSGTAIHSSDLAIRLEGAAIVNIELNDFFGYHTILMNMGEVKSFHMFLNHCVMSAEQGSCLLSDILRASNVRTGIEYNYCYATTPIAGLWGKNECFNLDDQVFIDAIQDGHRYLYALRCEMPEGSDEISIAIEDC